MANARDGLNHQGTEDEQLLPYCGSFIGEEMKSQELAAEKAPFLDRGEALKGKYNALAFIIMNGIFSIFVATRFAIRWSHAMVRPSIIALEHSSVEVILIVALIVLLMPLAFFKAWTLSRHLTSDPSSRKVILWSIQLSMQTVVTMANLVLFSILMFEFRFY